MEKYYLAVDIGASSGRHILGHMENGKIELEEISWHIRRSDVWQEIYRICSKYSSIR